MVASLAKSYNLPFDYILHRMSYANLVMYSSVLPHYGDSKKGNGETINADDPRNKNALKDLF